MRCTEETRIQGDPECASEEDIDAWFGVKVATIKIINTKIDFNSFEDIATR